jgi:hypothetical protein
MLMAFFFVKEAPSKFGLENFVCYSEQNVTFAQDELGLI